MTFPSAIHILGHRGLITSDPALYQNSRPAFERAIAEADGFETDACRDREGTLHLIHEAKYIDPAKGVEYCLEEHLDPISAVRCGGRKLEELSTSETASLKLKSGASIPSLNDALALIGRNPGKIINIELKGFDVADPVVECCRSAVQKGVIAPAQILISTFNLPALARLKAKAVPFHLGAIFIAPDQASKPIFPWHPGSEGIYTSLTPESLSHPLVRTIDPDIVVMPDDTFTKTHMDCIAALLPKAKCGAWVFTERGTFEQKEFNARLKTLPRDRIGVLMPDYPAEFKKALEEAGLSLAR